MILMNAAMGSMIYTNSMLNPILYAFLSEPFRKAFILAFKCAANTKFGSPMDNRHSLQRKQKNNQYVSRKHYGEAELAPE